MFTNLIESDSHRKEFKRRSSFFLATVAAYALILSAAGVASIYAYDAHLEAQNTDLLVDYWVPPIMTAPASQPHVTQPPRRSAPSNAPVDRNARVQERTEAISTTADPSRTPDHIGTTAPNVPPVTDSHFLITGRNINPPDLAPRGNGGCVTCTGTDPVVRVPDTTPPPVPAPPKPPTQRLTSIVLISHAVSLPQPIYPPIAKQIRLGGNVAVQILVDEQGKVVAAHAVNGHPILNPAAVEAAFRARFTPTMLNGQAVKVQGVITYNFVLQ